MFGIFYIVVTLIKAQLYLLTGESYEWMGITHNKYMSYACL